MSRNNIFIATMSSQKSGSGTPVGDRNITSVQTVPDFSVDYGTFFNDISGVSLPSSLIVSLDDQTSASLAVVWDSANFDGTVVGPITITGELQLVTGIFNPQDIQPDVEITVLVDVLYDVYGAVDGDDVTGDGSEANPYQTIGKCITEAVVLGGLRTIRLGIGTFVLDAYTVLPVNISIHGTSKESTIITGDPSLAYDADVTLSEWGLDKYLLTLSSVTSTASNQTLRDF